MADKLYNTIHIFGFGIVKVIGNGFNYQIQGSMVQMELDSCINNVYENKPTNSTTPNTYHAINVFNDSFTDWLAKEEGQESFRVESSKLNTTLFDALAMAVIGFNPSTSLPIVEPPLPSFDAPTT
jgi:hypothetical protein